jgi:hypothetical protein
MGAFLSFDKFVTPAVIKVVYWIGIVGIVISGAVWAIAGAQYSAFAPIGAIVGAILGLFLWRVYCEVIMLWFKIYDEMVGIRKNTAK